MNSTNRFADPLHSLGVNPNEIYTNSAISQLLNSTIDSQGSDFIIININSPVMNTSYISATTSICGILADDELSLEFGSTFTRPFANVANDLIGQGKTTFQTFSGLGLYNPISMIPQWQAPNIPSYSIKFQLIATSDPVMQIEKPLLLLSKLCLPVSLGGAIGGFSAQVPGPQFTADSIKSAFLDPTSGTLNQDINNNSTIIAIYYGNLALFESVIITKVSYTVPNIRTINELQGVTNSINGGEIGKSYYIWADVILTFEPVLPPQVNESNTDLQACTLFPGKYETDIF